MRYLTILLMAILLSGCSPKTVYVPVESATVRTDTVHSANVRVDSVIYHDFVSQIQKGDTVFITTYRDRYRTRERRDTVYVAKTDSVKVREPYPVEKIVEVERPLAWWQSTLMWFGVASLVILILRYFKSKGKKD